MLFLSLFALIAPIAGKVCNVLSLSGGGAFGVNEVGILKSLSDKGELPVFDAITGISAGGLNAGMLSYFQEIDEGLEQLKYIYYNMKTKDIYQKNTFGIFSFFKSWGFYDTSPLKYFLHQQLEKLHHTKITPQITTFIGSTSLYAEQMKVFDFKKFSLEQQVDILMATSAIPILFPPVKINGTTFVDGGLISNEMIEPLFDLLNCEKYIFTIITANNIDIKYSKVTSIKSYIEKILKIAYNSFESDLFRVKYDRLLKSVKICYPTFDTTKFSKLNFNNGKELYSNSYHHYKCTINLFDDLR